LVSSYREKKNSNINIAYWATMPGMDDLMQRKCQFEIILYIQTMFRFIKILLHAYCEFDKHDVIVDLYVSLMKITSWY
jgi:hypothetical protein